jgi:hypothetical protein
MPWVVFQLKKDGNYEVSTKIIFKPQIPSLAIQFKNKDFSVFLNFNSNFRLLKKNRNINQKKMTFDTD